MAQPVIQTAFHAGEWAPALNARVDLAKYHSAAALLENFFVDYRGGASTRAGTRYIIQCLKSNHPVRVIGFQASQQVGYLIELGDFYARFINNGAPVLEPTNAITAASKANPGVLTVVNSYSIGDVFYISGIGGMTQLNGRYFKVGTGSTGAAINLADLNDDPVDTTGYSTYTVGGTVARVYTIPTPYAAEDLALLKFTQNVNTMVLCHTSYQPYELKLITATNWTLLPITFGTTQAAPTNVAATTTLASGSVNYAYLVTAVDSNGQESGVSNIATLLAKTDLRTVAGTNSLTWTAAPGAKSYNVYKAELSYTGAVPAGAAYGFIGNCTGAAFDDSNIAPDFSQTPPIVQNPFQGAGLASVTVTVQGTYTTVPSATVANAPSGGSTATVQPVLGVLSLSNIGNQNSGFVVGDLVIPNGTNAYGGLTLRITAVSGGFPTAAVIQNPGAISSGNTPANPVVFKRASGSGTAFQVDLVWGVVQVAIINAGAGYIAAPAITFSAGIAAATASLDEASAGNPAVPAFFQQRLVLSAQLNALQSFNMSQPGAPYNFNIRNPIQPDDAIIGAAITSGQLNTIKSHVSMPNGLITLSDKAAWLLNGGSGGEAITPINATANAQSYNGASDVPPIVANFDILYIQAKGSVVRDLSYNFYANIFTGTDISVLSSHLFFGFQILEWAWAEEPFKIVWAIRDDGVMLSLTFMKEQELIGWTHSTTQGSFKSVAEVVEEVDNFGSINAVYNVVERDIPGVGTVKYIERHAERFFPNGVVDAWCVDSGLQYRGAPAMTFTGAEHLAGLMVTGLADGQVITPFEMPSNGIFTLPTAASVVTIGLAYTCNLQTLAIDLGEPTVQGKRKKVTAVTVRAQETLGLRIGSDEDNLVIMDDFVEGNVGSQTNELVTDLVTGDGRQIIDPDWSEQGDYLIRQDQPLPASILGVIPEVTVGDTADKGKSR